MSLEDLDKVIEKKKVLNEYEIFPGFLVLRFEDENDLCVSMDEIKEKMGKVAEEDFYSNPMNWRHP